MIVRSRGHSSDASWTIEHDDAASAIPLRKRPGIIFIFWTPANRRRLGLVFLLDCAKKAVETIDDVFLSPLVQHSTEADGCRGPIGEWGC